MTRKTVISDIEAHCNNYFNRNNDKSDPERNYPPEFLKLAKSILQFRKENKVSAVISESVTGFYQSTKGTAASGNPVTWQHVFSGELSPYKRLKSI